jgi:hypothetical protein
MGRAPGTPMAKRLAHIELRGLMPTIRLAWPYPDSIARIGIDSIVPAVCLTLAFPLRATRAESETTFPPTNQASPHLSHMSLKNMDLNYLSVQQCGFFTQRRRPRRISGNVSQ